MHRLKEEAQQRKKQVRTIEKRKTRKRNLESRKGDKTKGENRIRKGRRGRDIKTKKSWK